jgi:hypothetical protein
MSRLRALSFAVMLAAKLGARSRATMQQHELSIGDSMGSCLLLQRSLLEDEQQRQHFCSTGSILDAEKTGRIATTRRRRWWPSE